jgi:hypothetical protein
LGFVDRKNAINTFQFHDDLIFDDNIHSITAFQFEVEHKILPKTMVSDW